MKKCVKINFSIPSADSFLQSVHKQARIMAIEGTLQIVAPEKMVKVVACGDKERVDDFLDFIHKEGAKVGVHDITAESMLKEKDYRGVFRIIE